VSPPLTTQFNRCSAASFCASAATVTAGARSNVDSGTDDAGARFGAGRLPYEFLAAGSATSLERIRAAAENRTDVLLSILDGAVLPPFPTLDDLSLSLAAATGANTHDVVSVAPTAHLRRYLSKLNPSEAGAYTRSLFSSTSALFVAQGVR